MRWKIKGWKRLMDYIDGGVQRPRVWTLYHNIGCWKRPAALREFRENDSYRRKRKRGVVLYHEILSINARDRAHVTPEMLEDLTRRYVELRAPDALVYARPHLEGRNPHVHLMISGTALRSARPMRLDDRRFRQVRLDLEAYQQARYPELRHSLVYGTFRKQRRKDQRRADRNRRRQAEREMKRRGAATHKERLITALTDALKDSRSMTEALDRLRPLDIAPYARKGETIGIRFGGRRYRFATLGIEARYFRELERDGEEKHFEERRARLLDIMQQHREEQERKR